jgi:hypothetical protein
MTKEELVRQYKEALKHAPLTTWEGEVKKMEKIYDSNDGKPLPDIVIKLNTYD